MTLYTTYDLPPPPREAYVNYVNYAVAPKIAANMSACATNATYAYAARDAAGINVAIQNMFAVAYEKIRLQK
jgi:hypothetical protein